MCLASPPIDSPTAAAGSLEPSKAPPPAGTVGDGGGATVAGVVAITAGVVAAAAEAR